MESKVKEHIAPKQPVADTSEREGTSADRNWLEAELLACGVPEFGLDQWLRHFMEDALATDMSDEKLLNFFCLARDKALSDDEDFVNILTQTEDVLFARMSSNRRNTGEDTERMGYEPDEHADAIEALCVGNLTDSQLVELFDLSATLRAEPGVGHMWLAVMFLSRTQILRRMKHARRRKAPDNEELPANNPGPTDSSCSTDPLEPAAGQKNYSAQSQQMRPLVDLPVIPWMTHAYEVAELAFREDMPDGQLLDLVQLADWMRNYEHNCQTHDEWDSMRRDAANMILRRLLGKDCALLSDKWPYDTRSWRLNEFRDAEHRLPGLDAATLVHLYIQTGENAFLCAREPLQTHWENVGARCRTEILRRIGARLFTSASMAAIHSPSANVEDTGTDDGDEDVGEDDQSEELISTREALRIAEESFRPDISNAQLLELYVLTEENSNPDEDVFDEIADEVSDMVWDRLRKGILEPAFERHLENFDYPDHGKQALKALLKGRLPHRNLLMLYRLCWDSTDPTWLAVQDLCRGQILRRMTPPQEREGRDYQRWRQLQLTRRVQLYR
ncbi:hypothetical protein [Asticcacaulis taihuensis]|uniref:hypothetical protein n=1 Tax=Asticcacaulis taihuensis TaxID=260084 RepID=UPI003F7B7E46